MLRAVEDRQVADEYLTPPLLASAICKTLAGTCALRPARILEPSAGAGVFITAARAAWPHALIVDACEIQERYKPVLKKLVLSGRVVTGDFAAYTNGHPYDLVLGNPPYSLAQPHVERALTLVRDGGFVAFLLRMGFLGSAKRARSIWATTPLRCLIPIAHRPSFIEGTNDNSEYGVFVWQRSWRERPELIMPPLLWRD